MNHKSLKQKYSPYVTLTRDEWRTLRASTPLPLTADELEALRGLNDRVSLDEVSEVYLPLSRLLNLYVAAKQNLHVTTNAFLGSLGQKVPYIIGIAGSVAVGKSTTARIIQTLLARWPNHPKVDLITTDGFLFPNKVLEQRGIMNRKGFPESYDVKALIRFLADVKSGKPEVHAPVYSHLTYDIVEDERIVIRQPDIVIVEGLNVLQTTTPDFSSAKSPRLFVSDFFDFSIYVDAKEEFIQEWYIQRFQALRHTAFRDKTSFFHKFATLTDEEAVEMGLGVWREINEKNLVENILPTRERAHLILQKGDDHAIQSVRLRKL